MRYGQPNSISSQVASIHTPTKQDIIACAQPWEPASAMRAGPSRAGNQSGPIAHTAIDRRRHNNFEIQCFIYKNICFQKDK
jgi:hypothetical protein